MVEMHNYYDVWINYKVGFVVRFRLFLDVSEKGTISLAKGTNSLFGLYCVNSYPVP